MNWEAVIAIAAVLELIASVFMGVAIYYVNAKASRIDSLEKAVTDKAEDLVAARMETLAAEMKAPFTELRTLVGDMRERLERGDDKFDRGDEALHSLQLKALTKLEEARSEFHQTFATRDEFDRLADALKHVEVRLATFQAECRASRHFPPHAHAKPSAD
jgi:hypothetical protein